MGSRNDCTDADANANDYYGSADANLNASTSSGNDRTDANGYYGGADANDYYGCPHGGDHLACDECRLLSTNDNHGNFCNGSWLLGTSDNHGWRLRAVANDFVSQLTMPQVVRSFDYEFWRLYLRQFCILLVI